MLVLGSKVKREQEMHVLPRENVLEKKCVEVVKKEQEKYVKEKRGRICC